MSLVFHTPWRPRRTDLTPMIDVVFLLLVFFMLASRFGVDRALPLSLARGGSEYSGPPRLVGVGPDSVTLNGVTRGIDEVVAQLASMTGAPDDVIVLQPAEGAPVQRVVEVLEALTAAGYRRVVLVGGPRMTFDEPPRRASGQTFLPMINVVFLLLIFFLIAARLAPPEPFGITPPAAASEAAGEGEIALYLGADGTIGYRDITGEDAALAAIQRDLAEVCPAPCAPEDRKPLTVRADAAAPATALALLMPKLADLGASRIELSVVPR